MQKFLRWNEELAKEAYDLMVGGYSADAVTRLFVDRGHSLTKNALIGLMSRYRKRNSLPPVKKARPPGLTPPRPPRPPRPRLPRKPRPSHPNYTRRDYQLKYPLQKLAVSDPRTCDYDPGRTEVAHDYDLSQLARANRIVKITYTPEEKAPLWVKMLDLERHHCRFPVGLGKGMDSTYCGQPRFAESSYCEYHHWRCHHVVAK